ncbi:lipoprotein insertase outer membrane protein LolB [Lysobacter sp. A3-1-A15]|uniref:lipoprotein insertase outer membrane protein LolB n=1 Tax=Novilysobacter viscosus TaxID=3098602 RepID=UPI002ED7D73F
MTPRRTPSRFFIVAIAAALLASSCAVQPTRTALPPAEEAAAQARQAAREAALRPQDAWSLEGRIAVSNDGKGGSGRIDWTQRGQAYEISLSAPVTRQSWRLSADAGGARLEGVEGGPRAGPDAQQLLLEATGWAIPVGALSDWVRGMRAQSAGPARLEFDASGRLARLHQGGWVIDYLWPDAVGAGSGLALPRRLDASRGEARVRLLVDAWSGNPPADDGTADPSVR